MNERLQAPIFTLSPEQKQAIGAKAQELEGAEDIVVYTVSGLISIGMQYDQDRPYFGHVIESEALRNLTFPVYFEAAILLIAMAMLLPFQKGKSL